MKYAVIQSGGKQYLVKEGETLRVDKLESTKDAVAFDKVLLMVNDEQVVVGNPYIPAAKITAKVLGQVKGPKIRVSTYKAKVRQRRVIGFRAAQTQVQIDTFGNKKDSQEETPVEKPARKKTEK